MSGNGPRVVSEGSVQLGRNNLVSVATLIAVCFATAGGTLWVAKNDNRMTNFEAQQVVQAAAIDDLRQSVDGLRLEIARRQDGYVSRDQLTLMFRLLERANPQLDIPQELFSSRGN